MELALSTYFLIYVYLACDAFQKEQVYSTENKTRTLKTVSESLPGQQKLFCAKFCGLKVQDTLSFPVVSLIWRHLIVKNSDVGQQLFLSVLVCKKSSCQFLSSFIENQNFTASRMFRFERSLSEADTTIASHLDPQAHVLYLRHKRRFAMGICFCSFGSCGELNLLKFKPPA